MKYLSVCSGIEAASVAWHPFGWTPLAFSEIEAFPRAVLAHHYPDVPLHGDFTVLRNQDWIADADVLVGGTPCQAFSVAGLRNSLSDERGNLSLEFVRLANAIDNARHDAGREPGIVVWENVPGVLSVKDNAFGSFLAGLAGEDEALVPSGKRWTNAGCVFGPQRTVAWRVLDAQYFGLAQRRRRVFVVASAREGFDPAAVLLEFEGVRRDSPPRREAGQAASGGASGRAGGGGVTEQLSDSLTVGANQTTGFSSPSVDGYSHWDDPNAPHPTLNQSHNTGGVGQSNQELFSQRGAYLVGDNLASTMSGEDIAPCLIKSMGSAVRNTQDAGVIAVTHALRGEGFDASEDGTGRGTPLVPVMQPLPFDTTQITSASNYSRPQPGDPCHPLAAGAHPPAIAFSAKDHGADASVDLSPTLRAMPHDASHANGGGQMAVAIPVQEVGKRTGTSTTDPRAGIGIGEDGDPMYTLQAGAQHGVAFAFKPGQSEAAGGTFVTEEFTPTLQAQNNGSTAVPAVAYAFQPRIARNGRGDMGELVNALNAQSGETGKGDAAPCVAVAFHTANSNMKGPIARSDGIFMGVEPHPSQSRHAVFVNMAVRRLTPVECERLQGFPDGYTNIPWRKQPTAPDGPRYKALGNSMAVPCMRWIGRRIANAIA